MKTLINLVQCGSCERDFDDETVVLNGESGLCEDCTVRCRKCRVVLEGEPGERKVCATCVASFLAELRKNEEIEQSMEEGRKTMFADGMVKRDVTPDEEKEYREREWQMTVVAEQRRLDGEFNGGTAVKYCVMCGCSLALWQIDEGLRTCEECEGN